MLLALREFYWQAFLKKFFKGESTGIYAAQATAIHGLPFAAIF